MGTESLRLFLLLHIVFACILARANDPYDHRRQQRITLRGLFTPHHSPSIHFALEQINNHLVFSSSPSIVREFALNSTEGIIHVRHQ
jgi:hypothetical protein